MEYGYLQRWDLGGVGVPPPPPDATIPATSKMHDFWLKKFKKWKFSLKNVHFSLQNRSEIAIFA